MKQLITVLLCVGVLFSLEAASTTHQQVGNPPVQLKQSWGPDTYGYTAKDSNEPGGPPVSWIDISTIGTPVSGLGDDNIVGPFNVGFPFHYYWYDVTSFYIGSNGYLRFSGAGQLSSPFTTIPNPTAPNDVVAVYGADFDPSSGGTVYTWTNFTDSLIVSFVGLPAWNTPSPNGSYTFQVILSMVDTSITFNYGTLTGTFYNTNGMVGIENNAGDIGIFCYPTNVVPANYSIKFYYPQSTTYQVHDIGVDRVQNENSGGFFVQTGNDLQANGTIHNLGNQNEGSFYAVAEVRQYPSGTVMFSDSVYVDTLEAGNSLEIDFPEIWTLGTAGDYYLRIRTTLTGDMVASNDQKDAELHVVDLPGELALDDGSSENIWSWAGGNGGMGIKYIPPAYPVKITELRAYLGSGTLPVLLQLYADDGVGGEPGTMLTSVSLTASVESWYSVNLVDSNIVINDGAVYAVWMMTGDGASGLGIDQSTMGSRQTWEYTGVWAVYRDTEISDAMLRISVEQQGQVVFSDDFESGLGNWTGDWGLTTAASHSPSNSYTDSPGGNYPTNANLIGAMANGVDLSSYLGASLEFWTKYELETGFDYCYLEGSTDGGASWIRLKTYNGEGVVTQFTQETVDIGAFAGSPDFRIRFHLVSDGGYETDGMYVDDLRIIGSFLDESPPLLMFTPPENYEGVPDTFNFPVVITDLSGVASATLSYWVNTTNPVIVTVPAASVSGDTFNFQIPPLEHGSLVSFYIEAEDGASPSNSTTSETMSYIAGYPQIWDDGEPEYIVSLAAGTKCAVMFDMPTPPAVKLTTALLRIYTDVNRPTDSVTVHIWDDNNSFPGTDLTPPFKIYPSCTISQPEAWTVVDLRDLDLQPGAAFWIGYENTSSIEIWQLYDSPAVYNRSLQYTAGGWTALSGDFHIRAVLGVPPVGIQEPPAQLLPKEFALMHNYPNPFNPVTTLPFALPERSDVTIEVYNILGARVATVMQATKPAGYHKVQWQPNNLSSGIYFFRISAHGLSTGKQFHDVQKMILMK